MIKITKLQMKKKILQLSFLTLLSLIYGQNCDSIKSQLSKMKSENNNLSSENLYLKNALNINKPIYELDKDNTNFKIVKILGNKATKTVYINVIVVSKDENRNYVAGIGNISITDLEGNEVDADYMKSESSNGNLVLNVPKKITWAFTYNSKDDFNENRIIKLFKWRIDSRVESKKDSPNYLKTYLEFKDLNVDWK